jgi:hypothetical protein
VRREPLPLTDRLTALREAVEAADGALPAEQVQPARDLLAKAGARVALGDATVVALAGATGSGKSTLFNALAGEELSPPGCGGRPPAPRTRRSGARRAPRRCWTGSASRAGTCSPDPDPALDKLVLLDLPDHDSPPCSTGSRSTGSCSWSTCWCGCSTRRSTPTPPVPRPLPPRRRPGTPGVLVVVLSQVDRLDPAARQAAWPTCAGCWRPRAWPTCPCCRSRRHG